LSARPRRRPWQPPAPRPASQPRARRSSESRLFCFLSVRACWQSFRSNGDVAVALSCRICTVIS
jgi:hypothetical protein